MSTPDPQSLLDYLDDHQDDLIDFTCQLVATPSINPPGDERAVAEVIVGKLADLGLPKPQIVAKQEHRPNILCRLGGSEGSPVLLYNGHTDTKPVGEDARDLWKTDPLKPTFIGDKLYGLGSTDMKSGVAAMIYAAAALKAAGQLTGDLLLALTADEEAGSQLGARYLAEEYGIKADIGLISEPSGLRRELEEICIVSRGALCFRIRVKGTQMHSSTSDTFPSVNACAKMAYVLTRMERDLKVRHDPHPMYPGGVTKNIGVTVEGGVFYGVVPGTAEFCSDIRTLPGMTPRQVAEDVEAFLDELRADDPELDVEMITETTRQGALDVVQPEVSPDEPFVEMLQAASARVLGKPVPLGGFVGGTDAVFFHTAAGIPMLPAFGPGLLPLAHGPNEYVGLESIIQASKIHALAALDYLK